MGTFVEIDDRELFAQLRAPGGRVHRGIETRTQIVHRRAQWHVPVDLGLLWSTLRWEVRHSVDGPIGEVWAATRYVSYVEFGTRYMDPRPFLRPSIFGIGLLPVLNPVWEAREAESTARRAELRMLGEVGPGTPSPHIGRPEQLWLERPVM